ncbi:MAG: ubiquinol-cytochrome c reductase iron-sulfur subunit [Sandaracinaceae bacterium]
MTDSLSRRTLLKTSLPVITAAGFGGITIGCGGANIPSTVVHGGQVSALAEGAPQRLQSYDVFVVRTADGVAAISGRCTHAGCGVEPTSDGFHCGCHGSDFASDGTVTHGPADRDLAWYAVTIEDGEIVVDPTQEVAKGTYTPL